MKFEFEKVNLAYIRRRIREEQRKQKDGRRVTRVVLTKPEWYEFLTNEQSLRHYYPYDRLQVRGEIPWAYTLPSDEVYADDVVTTIEIVREP